MEEVETARDMVRKTPHIYASLEDHQATYQEVVVRMEGNISMHPISVLIDPGSTHSYVTLKADENYGINKKGKTSLGWSSQPLVQNER